MISRKKLFILFTIGLTFILVCLSAYTVQEYEWAIITQFGKPVEIVKNPGLHFKYPGLIHKVNSFDKRLDSFKTLPIQLLLGDKNPIIIDCYVVWKINDPLTFFQSVGDKENAIQKLSDMANSQLGIILGDYTIKNIINTDSKEVKLDEIEEKIKKNSNENAIEKYGIKIAKVGILKISYPLIVTEAVYDRMQSEREKEAEKLRAEGREKADKIRATADKKAKMITAEAEKFALVIKGEGDKESMKIYSEAYKQDPEFFEFIKSLEMYSSILKDNTTLILSTDSELLKYLNLTQKNNG